MAEGKKTFIFYSDWINMVREMPNEQAGELLKHILSYVNDENPVTDNILVKMAFAHMKPILKADLLRWDEVRKQRKKAGSKGGKQKVANAKQLVNGAKQTVAVNVNVNDIPKGINISIEERKLEFKKRVIAEQCEKYPMELLRDFFVYWSEHGDKDKKMRWEKEKTFGLRSRLHTFKNLQEKWKTKKDRL